jgi:hypothetical protein
LKKWAVHYDGERSARFDLCLSPAKPASDLACDQSGIC